jgi:hypothetical protein
MVVACKQFSVEFYEQVLSALRGAAIMEFFRPAQRATTMPFSFETGSRG